MLVKIYYLLLLFLLSTAALILRSSATTLRIHRHLVHHMREPTPSSPMEAHQPGDDGDATTTGAEEEDQGGREQPRQAGGDIASAMARAAEAHPDDIDKQIEVALQCPCVEDMMTSPCKETFVDSFTCFMKSDHHEVKGYDCVEQFERFQACLVANPGVIGAYWPRSTCARGHSRDAHSCSPVLTRAWRFARSPDDFVTGNIEEEARRGDDDGAR